MRIAIFTELYAPSIGGQEKFFAGLGRALLRRGHQVDVYCIAHEEGLPKRESLGGITVNRFPTAPHYKTPRFKAMRRDWVAIGRFAWHVRTIAKKREHDFYLLNQWPLLHVLALPGPAKRKALLHWCETRNSPFFKAVQKMLPGRVGLNAAISETVGEEIRATSRQEVITLPSGLDLSFGTTCDRQNRSGILAIGRVTAHKNLPMLVEAFEALKARGYPGRLKIAGDGPDMAALQARVAASELRREINLFGLVSDERKAELLMESELLAMPSKREGFPHAVSEAMFFGLPIVTADYPENGTKAIVKKFNSGIVTEPNANAFADGLVKALSQWETFSANARSAAQTLDWNAIAENLERELLSVTGHHESRTRRLKTA
jgi:glycosyltransferase involved in cell wall biosynthesis